VRLHQEREVPRLEEAAKGPKATDFQPACTRTMGRESVFNHS
jgi:hypothetical protein